MILNTETTSKTYTIAEAQFFSFDLVSKRSGRRYPMSMVGRDRDDARQNMLDGWLKNQVWDHWTLEDK